MIGLPGRSYRGALPPLTSEQQLLRERLRTHVDQLAGIIGERNVYRGGSLDRAAQYIEEQFAASGYEPAGQEYGAAGTTVRNIESAHVRGTGDAVVVGAHYDTVAGCPGANDNASGVAALLELARHCTDRARLRFVAFVNEEPPFFMSELMGSRVYARRCRARGERLAGMFSLETIGYYTSAPDTQQYPGPVVLQRMYPSTGNFIGFVSNVASRRFMRAAGREFRRRAQFPSEGVSAPADLPGIGWSDHWSFWQEGYPAVMITDTAPFRYPHYHEPSDTSDKLDYDSLARVVSGLRDMLSAL
ncbi:MAG TPA: M28 family peptidase [Vicinamibacterales bacterium]|nr:M28 family peptidase [Vicinamibacterales bacterium]